MKSREKGKRGEREWAEYLNLHVPDANARRGQQFSGSPDSPDVVSDLPYHFEVKRVERLNINKAMRQAMEECGDLPPVVPHRCNRMPWLVTMLAEDWIKRERCTCGKKKATDG